MACICVEMKERIEREKEKAYLKGRKIENAAERVTEEESWPAKCSEWMKGSFLRKGKRKLSQKDEKRKREMGSFKSKSPKKLETSRKPNSPTRKNTNSINQNMPRGHSPRSATTHLIRHSIPRVKKKKKKHFHLLWSSWDSMMTKESGGNWRSWRNKLKTNTSVLTRSFPRRAQETPTSLTKTV